MVSTMNPNSKDQICDNPKVSTSAITQRAIDLHLKQSTSADQDLAKLTMKLKLASPTDESVKMQMIRKLRSQDSVTSSSLSPKSPTSSGKSAGGRTTITTQSSITTPSIVTNEVVDDRKALRDMLYQGIWVRHRRTIFSVGSFLRMLKSKNTHNYNTIRSTSENEDESR